MDVKFPIGKLQVPNQVTLENIQEWLKEIETYTNRLRDTVDSLSDEELSRTYRDGSWTVHQFVPSHCRFSVEHVSTFEDCFNRSKIQQHQISIKINGLIQPDTHLPVESSIKMLEGINERIVSLGSSLTEEQLHRVFTHQINGEITVATKVAKLAWHEEHHLAHIKIALSK